MTTDNKTLAGVQPGGRVRLGDQAERARFEEWASAEGLNAHIHSANGMYSHPVARGAWLAWQHLSAQPSPGGQDALATLIDQWMARADRHEASALEADSIGGMQMAVAVHEARAAELNAAVHSLKEALAARQPVGDPVFRERPTHNAYRGSFSGPCRCWADADHAVGNEVMRYAAPPAQAVDLPYSLDADPAGIRARVCDVITGTLMVGAQGHTPPPVGHWAEPFWQAARADAKAQAVDLEQFRPLASYVIEQAAGTRGDMHMLACQLLALIDSRAVGNG